MIKIGILREGKIPPDFRVPLTPEQCSEINEAYKGRVEVVVQESAIRTYTDEEYQAKGVQVVADLSGCDIIMGVKEVQIDDLIPNKTYIFFSHTVKEQPYNRQLLQTILERKISLIDYEVIKDTKGVRLIGFGKYAGIVGAYNGFRAYGLKTKRYELTKATVINDREKVELELEKVSLPADFRLVLTGFGRVGHGAREIVSLLPIREVTKEEFFTASFDEPIFVHLNTQDYYRRKADRGFETSEFYANPTGYESYLTDYLEIADMYITCHFWDERAPLLVTKNDLQNKLHRLSVIADISCDIKVPIESTIRPSTIENPIYGYNKQTHKEDDFLKEGVLTVMAVDNLPCELPKDASRDFGREFIDFVLPHLVEEDADGVIANSYVTNNKGELTPSFSYLTDYVAKK